MPGLNYQREQELFEACLELPASEHAAYLARACETDPTLRDRVERLLAAHRRAEEATLSPLRSLSLADPSDRIGSYHVLRVLGEGGMGVVYEAEQLEPVRRRVALKIVKLGMDSAQVVNRFMAERQTLAALDHPYVAKVFDAGQTGSGRPYFVMELVEGTPVAEFCDRERLPVRRRIELFVMICHALQHAHQKGVIHRDLKPSNVLVTAASGNPIPKIIDFGIAKAIGFNADGTLTRAEQVLGTPAYMSPEQAGRGGHDIDTRADIYSLGVILYELLAGCLPVDPGEITELDFLARLANGQLQPGRPSTRAGDPGRKREIAGDLDWIVMKALETDRERRYDTAAALAQDLERHLSGQPVAARPPTVSYRLSKFVRRHRIQVAAASIAAIAMIGGGVAAAIGFVRATRAQALAKEEAATARQVSDFLVGLFGAADPHNAPDKMITLRELLDRGAARVDSELKGQPKAQVNLLNTLSYVYESLGLFQQAKKLGEEALAICRRENWPDDLPTADALLGLGRIDQRLDLLAEASRLMERALEIRIRLLGENDLRVSIALNGLGGLYNQLERLDESLAAQRRALAIQKRVGGPDHIRVYNSLRGIGNALDRKGDAAGALEAYRGSLAVAEKNYGPNHPIIADCLNNMARMLRVLKQLDEAEALLTRALELRRRGLGPNHYQVAFDCAALGRVLVEKGKYKEGRAMFEEGIRIREATVGPENIRTGELVGSLGRLLLRTGETQAAVTALDRALRILLRVYGPNHQDTLDAQRDLAAALLEARRYNDAIPHLREVVLHDWPTKPKINLADAKYDPLRRLPAFRELRTSLASPSSSADRSAR